MSRHARTIPSTHTGSLPRPDDLIQIMWAVGDGIPVDAKALICPQDGQTPVLRTLDHKIADLPPRPNS